MERKFWILVLGSVVIPFSLLSVGGLYLLKDQRQEDLQSQSRVHLKKNLFFYEDILDIKLKNIPDQNKISEADVISAFRSLFSKEMTYMSFIALNRKGDVLASNNKSLNITLVKESLKKNAPLRSQWFVKINKKDKKDSVLFFIKQWKDSDIFLLASESIRTSVLVQSPLSLIWIGICILFALLVFSLLLLVIQPLFSAYKSLQSAFVYLGKTGVAPSWLDSSRNSFLQFYKNWRFLLYKKQKRDRKDLPLDERNKTFRDVVEEEISKIKEKFPRVSVNWNIQSDINLWNFSYFMKRICREVILNAIEAMGGNKEQQIDISSWEKEGEFFFSVRDNGCGLSDKDLEKIFTLYYSTKSQLGVGLNVAQSLILSNEGSLEIFPLASGFGTEVIVRLPLKCFLQNHLNDQQDNLELTGGHWKEKFYKDSSSDQSSRLT